MSNNRIVWLSASDPCDAFPPLDAALADPDGLIAAGGDLGTKRLLYAYRHAIFPWYSEGQPILWWSPEPRCVFKPGDFHVSRRLRRYLRQSTAEVQFNTSFGEVIRACAAPRASETGTWITAEMIGAYERLHREGWAHSVEIWREGALIGGLYGLAIGQAFFGESMFSKEANASKIALLVLSAMMDSGAFGVLDCQLVSGHLRSLGAKLLAREQFVALLGNLCDPAAPFENWPTAPRSVTEFM